MRLIAFLLALVSFVTGLCAIVAGAIMCSPLYGVVFTLLGFGLTVFWIVVAERY